MCDEKRAQVIARADLGQWVRENPDWDFPVWPLEKGRVYIKAGLQTNNGKRFDASGGRSRPEVVSGPGRPGRPRWRRRKPTALGSGRVAERSCSDGQLTRRAPPDKTRACASRAQKPCARSFRSITRERFSPSASHGDNHAGRSLLCKKKDSAGRRTRGSGSSSSLASASPRKCETVRSDLAMHGSACSDT